jgi:hypothetical protein
LPSFMLAPLLLPPPLRLWKAWKLKKDRDRLLPGKAAATACTQSIHPSVKIKTDGPWTHPWH